VAKRVTFSGAHMSLESISLHYVDCESAIETYFDAAYHHLVRFRGLTPDEVVEQKKERIDELSRATSLTILAALEAVFRIDYLQRVRMRKRDSVSQAFRALYKSKGHEVSLEHDILEIWKKHIQPSRVVSKTIGELKGTLKYRHWLAHGRYWVLKADHTSYDYETVYGLAEQIMDSFQFEGLDA